MDALALAVAAALLFAGVAAVAVREWRILTSALVVGLSLALFASADDLAAPPSLAVVANAVGPVLAPIAAWAVLCRRPPAYVALAAGVVAGPVSTLLYDPFYDLHCLTICDSNPFAITHVSSTVQSALWAADFVAATALTFAGLRGPARLPVLVLAAAAWFLAFDPSSALESGIVTGAVLLVVGGSTVARDFEARARVADLARALESAADVEATLRAATGDPGITVSYLMDSGSEEVDRHGFPTYGSGPGQVSTDITGPAGVVARVHHDPDRTDLAALAAALTGPARLAFENGRLEATVRRQAHALEASRRRIVVHADTERRRLERDLHDGAQQHLLALGLALRTSLDAAAGPESREVLHRCLASTHVALGEVRELSHGFYPASLEQTGLGNALDGVADRARVPVSVGTLPDGRLPAEIERAIYLLVARAAATATRPVEVSVATHDDEVEVVVVGARPPDGVLADVFAVLGGSLDSDDPSRVGSPSVVRGRLPRHEQLAAVPS